MKEDTVALPIRKAKAWSSTVCTSCQDQGRVGDVGSRGYARQRTRAHRGTAHRHPVGQGRPYMCTSLSLSPMAVTSFAKKRVPANKYYIRVFNFTLSPSPPLPGSILSLIMCTHPHLQVTSVCAASSLWPSRCANAPCFEVAKKHGNRLRMWSLGCHRQGLKYKLPSLFPPVQLPY